eukprot:SAG31_NODE_23701_length_498_cov_0.927318_1_plen_85_part_00
MLLGSISDEASRLAAAWADGSAAEREAAYDSVETIARTSASQGHGAHAQAVALAAACITPLSSLLCAVRRPGDSNLGHQIPYDF